MGDREAVSTIRGYYYQFDYSLIKVLELNNDTDTICIEGIEDVDINDIDSISLHQCKCYEKTEYNHSVVAPAIRWMLIHFSKNKRKNYKYYVYGVFKSGQNKLKLLTVEFAKKHFFTYTKEKQKHLLHDELGLTDEDIDKFLKKLRININAESYEAQEDKAKNKLCTALGCRKQDVEPYYCNALLIIKKLATGKTISSRTISRKEFINQLKTVDAQFELWLLHKKGKAQFAKIIRKKYFSNMNLSPYSRFFLFECDAHTTIVDLKTIILQISKKYSKLSKRSSPRFCPYFYFYGLDDKKLLELKKTFAKEKIKFTDGYDFKGADFSCESITEEPAANNPIKFRIIDDLSLLIKTYNSLSSTIEIYQFYINSVFHECSDYKHIKIPIECITDTIDIV